MSKVTVYPIRPVIEEIRVVCKHEPLDTMRIDMPLDEADRPTLFFSATHQDPRDDEAFRHVSVALEHNDSILLVGALATSLGYRLEKI